MLSSKLLIKVLVVTQPTTLPNSYVPNESQLSQYCTTYYYRLDLVHRISIYHLLLSSYSLRLRRERHDASSSEPTYRLAYLPISLTSGNPLSNPVRDILHVNRRESQSVSSRDSPFGSVPYLPSRGTVLLFGTVRPLGGTFEVSLAEIPRS